jgi:hypothetical protein
LVVIATTSVFGVVVIAPGIENAVAPVPAVALPAVTSHGLPVATAPRNVMILA